MGKLNLVVENCVGKYPGTNQKIYEYDYDEFKKLNLNEFKVELGFDTQTEYLYDDVDDENYEEEVEIEDYEKFMLIDQKIFDVDELLEFTGYDDYYKNLDDIVSNITNGVEFVKLFESLIEKYLEYDLSDLTTGEFKLKDFVFRFILDDSEIVIS